MSKVVKYVPANGGHFDTYFLNTTHKPKIEVSISSNKKWRL